jgi:thiol:disulfide interchange protein DsbD
LISVTGNHILPKSGNWMIKIKQFLGMLILALIIYVLHPLLTESFIYLLSGLWVIGLALLVFYSVQNKKLRGFFSLILISLSCIMITYPYLKKISQPQEKIFTVSINNPNDLSTILALSQREKKIVILDFHASWCLACQEMDLTTWTNPQLLALMTKTKNVRIDVSKNDDNARNLEKIYHVFAPPAVIIISPTGKIAQSFIGNTKAETLITSLQKLN